MAALIRIQEESSTAVRALRNSNSDKSSVFATFAARLFLTSRSVNLASVWTAVKSSLALKRTGLLPAWKLQREVTTVTGVVAWGVVTWVAVGVDGVAVGICDLSLLLVLMFREVLE